MTTPILRVEDLSVRLPTPNGMLQAVSNVSLSVLPGEFVGIVGESGCGKTTLALSILRLLHESAVVTGEVTLRGQDLLGANDEELLALRRGSIAFVPQDPLASLDPTYPVGAQIAETVRAKDRTVSRRAARAQAVSLMEQVGIARAAERYSDAPHTFSGGMRQRIAIAIAIANRPAVIVADEPTTALDVTVQRQVLLLLRRLASETGTAVCLITHDLGVVHDVCDRVAVLYAGRVVEIGPVKTVLDAPQHPYTRALTRAVPKAEVPRGQLAVIPGELPNAISLPAGCNFAVRCPSRMHRCDEEPGLIDSDQGTRAACWLLERPETEQSAGTRGATGDE